MRYNLAMTTNTNANELPAIDRVSIIRYAARALNVADNVLHDVVDAAIDVTTNDYDDDALRALHTLANSLFTNDDSYDEFRLELRTALDMLDDDDRAMIDAYERFI